MAGEALLFMIALYFVPTMVAATRGHQSLGSILVINLFLGWTLIGWVVALAMAVGPAKAPVTKVVVRAQAMAYAPAPSREKALAQRSTPMPWPPGFGGAPQIDRQEPALRAPPAASDTALSIDELRAAIARDELPEPGWPWRVFRLGVSGESYANHDGSQRQEIIAGLRAGDVLDLVCEPGNRFDREAVKVCAADGRQIGYLPSGHGLAPQVAAGDVGALVYRVNGGTADKPMRGVVALICVRES
jgi:hypothetical protein